MKRKALGKGLSALIPETSVKLPEGALQQLPIDKISPNPLQPRKNFHDSTMAELADSIKTHGVVQPVIVTRKGDNYQLVIGERRWRASKIAGLKHIPAMIQDVSEVAGLEIALIENLQRQDLNPIEEAQAFRYLVTQHGLTQEQLSRRVGKSRSAVANSLRLLSLPDDIKKDLAEGIITPGHARALLAIPDKELQKKVWHLIKNKNMSVRQAESTVTRLTKPVVKKTRKFPVIPEREYIVDSLRENLGTRVELKVKKSGRGKIEIYFSSNDELLDLVERILIQARKSKPGEDVSLL
ncbi:MAG: ParB/RepB/Spo0J family partition protein [Candidatus Eremiobacteraeota bacterium]|nr:ParB/RepB/Spo0J family partition protein [Candidatus Eremiobacteraeota bacterium]